ncbi:MAG: hypothetical protein M0P91_12310 [Sulfuricurvum sp.]|jgi:hypothetical protein|uniref:hypothetical protein n=1 Tax=Sulfuricurvum sp. TaxID=2025608 RepID=UPI0025EC7CDC|nr:hypothetical protein [Sulfuricurvum sp.]MCK9373969.1 hypothetical protein [Sulfuricurvum sp.]
MRRLFLLFYSVSLFSADYDPLLMRAQASIFPKIILLDQDVSKKTLNGSISLKVIYDGSERLQAKELKQLVDGQYKGKIGGYNFETELVHIDNFSASDDATAYILLDAADPKKRSVIARAAKNHRICFGYNYKDIENNILISLLMKEKTYIYLNKSALHEYTINFTPVFYRIVKVIE